MGGGGGVRTYAHVCVYGMCIVCTLLLLAAATSQENVLLHLVKEDACMFTLHKDPR